MGSEATYDWRSIYSKPSRTDLPEYRRPGLEVIAAPGKGLGLRTVEPVAAGELLLVESAFVSGYIEDCLSQADELLCSKRAPKRVRAQLCALAADESTEQQESSAAYRAVQKSPVPVDCWGDGTPEKELSTEQVRARLKKNGMAVVQMCEKPDGYISSETPPQPRMRMALYAIGALLNHDCSPNCERMPLSSSLVLRAGRALKAGEELTVYYTEVRRPLLVRRAELQEKWGFVCQCDRCRFESTLRPQLSAELNRCHEALEWFRKSGHASEGEMRTVVRAAKKYAEKGADKGKPRERAWLMAGAFVLMAFELATGLRCMGHHDEAALLLAEIEVTYVHVLPGSTMHACVAHCRSLADFARKAKARDGKAIDEETVESAFRHSMTIHRHCYGGGTDVWLFFVFKTLPEELHAAAMSLAMSGRATPEAADRLRAKRASELGAAASVAEPCEEEQSQPASTAAASDARADSSQPELSTTYSEGGASAPIDIQLSSLD